MKKIERILLECRYILSLDKSYSEIANYLNINEDIVYDDLNNQLPKIDQLLYKRIKNMKKISFNK